MATLLYIEASSRGDRSKSTQIARAFLAGYQQSHPEDSIRTLNLFDAEIPIFDGNTIRAKYTMMHGQEHSPQEKQAWKQVEDLIAEFKDADKYLLSVPMWNFSIPYRLKQYIDSLVQPGYTFNVVEGGYEGLVKDRPMTVIYARGGAYSEGSGKEKLDFQRPYVETIFGFIGIKNIHTIVAEPTLQGSPEAVEQAVKTTAEKAAAMARDF